MGGGHKKRHQSYIKGRGHSLYKLFVYYSLYCSLLADWHPPIKSYIRATSKRGGGHSLHKMFVYYSLYCSLLADCPHPIKSYIRAISKGVGHSLYKIFVYYSVTLPNWRLATIFQVTHFSMIGPASTRSLSWNNIISYKSHLLHVSNWEMRAAFPKFSWWRHFAECPLPHRVPVPFLQPCSSYIIMSSAVLALLLTCSTA